MICSPILLVGRSRSGDSCTYFSKAFTRLSSFDDGTGRFSQARNSPAMTLLRSKVSRRPSFLITMWGISSMRSYEVKRRSHFRHSRRRRMASPSRDSRESTTLSSTNPQNGHFISFDPLGDHFQLLVYCRDFKVLFSEGRFHFFSFHRFFRHTGRHQQAQSCNVNVAPKKIEKSEHGRRREIHQMQDDCDRGCFFG